MEMPTAVVPDDGGSSVELQRQDRRPRLRSNQPGASVVTTGAPHASARRGSVGAARAAARRGSADSSKPILGNDNNVLELGIEEVLIGIITLEGTIPSGVHEDHMSRCVKLSLATVASVPASYIQMSVTNEYSSGQTSNVVKFHFVLLPIPGTSIATATAIHQASVTSGTVAPLLVFLTKEMSMLSTRLV